MDPYQVHVESLALAGTRWRIRALIDGNQYWDPDGQAAARGIPETSWSHFGRIWPAGRVLAEVVGAPGAQHRRLLEVGCGLALAGLVAHRAQGDVTVSDVHPLTRAFLDHNLALNDLPPLAYHEVDWSRPQPRLGHFDTVVGSDILYEPTHAAQLAGFVARHTTEDARIIVVDPGRGHRGRFTRLLAEQGFECAISRPVGAAARTQVLHFRRR